MKRLLFSLLSIFLFSTLYAQKYEPTNVRDSILNDIMEDVSSIKGEKEIIGRYKLYPTENFHILLKLNTGTGTIKVLQWNLDEDKEFEVYLNSEDLSLGGLDYAGRFELYPTKNMFQFILIDTFLGSTWHVQWGTEVEKMWIRRISF